MMKASPNDESQRSSTTKLEKSTGTSSAHDGSVSRWSLALGVLGVCYGDLGTSAIYALQAAINGGSAPLMASRANVLGLLSLVFWTLIVVVSLKYMVFVLRADNRGEGGTFALIALLRPWHGIERRSKRLLILLGLAGAAMLYAGMMITPAITILSAVEGLEIASDRFSDFVIPITLVILVTLFSVQRLGTAKIGAIFGPIMALWFVAIAALGIYGISHEPSVLLAIHPVYALRFFQLNHWSGFFVLFGLFLVTTGAEACYADIGHFGRRPIQLVWFCFVLPALLLNYFGQGAMLLHASNAIKNPFFAVVPAWLLYPTVGIATVATIVASQAVISGAYSMTRQAGRLGMMPEIRVVQTSKDVSGQIYVPAINWTLMMATIFLVLTFGSSGRLASVYGISVSTTMVVTTILAFSVARDRAHWPLATALLLLVGFLSVDLTYFGSNVMRIPHGGWFPIVVAVVIFTLMSTWRKGGELLHRESDKDTNSVTELKAYLSQNQIARVPGTAIFLATPSGTVPPILQHQVERTRSLHQQLVLLTVLTEDVPQTTGDERIECHDLGDDFYHVVLHYGYMQQPNIPSELAACKDLGLKINLGDATYYLGHRSPISRHGKNDGMLAWRDRLFGFMRLNSSDETASYQIPNAQVVEIGLRVRI